MATSGISKPPRQLQVQAIFSDELCEYAQSIVFPWDLDRPLNAADVGRKLFSHRSPSSEWDVPEVKAALLKLAELGIEKVRENIDEFPEYVREASVDDGDLSAPDRNLGIILTLDHGARYLCTGVNSRYAYEFFQQVPIHTIKYITSQGMARLSEWEAAGIDKQQAIIRALMMLGCLVRSEDPEDHETHLRLVEGLRKEYERLTHTQDPYRQSFEQDIQDVNLYGRILEEGPPQGKVVHMYDVVYLMMRSFTSHVAYLRHFGRSPFMNVAVGRKDTDEEFQWLKGLGVNRTKEDEEARDKIREDIDNGRWRPLQL